MSNINFELYKIFYQVGLYKNITRAAKELYISQPAVTQHLRKLEDELGYKLFYRTRQGVEFTKEGEELFNNIKYSMECLENIKVGSNEDNQVKRISIGGSHSILMALIVPVLEKIKTEFEKYNIKLLRNSNEPLSNKILNNIIDIGVTTSPKKFEEQIEYIELKEIEYLLVCGKKLEIDKNKIIKLEDLNQMPLILPEKETSISNELNNLFNRNNIKLNPKYEISSFGLTIEAIKSGLGIGIVNRQFAKKELEDGEFIELKTNFEIPKRKIYLMINKNNKNRKDIYKMINIIKEGMIS